MDAIVMNLTEIFVEHEAKFSWHDYALFLVMLASSALIGVYFGCSGNKQSTADEYLLGGKEMGIFPISMSLIASFISGITILAVPADVYRYGSSYFWCGPSIALGILTTTYVFVPVFHKLQLSSTYEYMNLRFDDRVRKLCSFLYTVSMILYLPIVIYVPALALAQGTGFNIHLITPVVCGVCVFYTTIGGLKAVVWTDTVQFIVMIGSTVAITYLGTASSGGFSNIMSVSGDGGRLEMDFELDVTKRDTFWSSFVGLYFSWMTIIGIGQGCIQKCLALPTMAHVKKTMLIFAIGMLLLVLSSVYSGLMLFGKYADCDPFETKRITAYDQILPLFVLEVASNVPGLPGLFIAGVFSAALSTLSASMNSMSCTLYQDFISSHMPKDVTQKRVSNILKLLVALIGIVSTALVFVVERLGGILELGFSLGGITQGPILGLFALGMLVPAANSKAALTGALGSLVCMCWVVMGSQYYKINGMFKYETKPISIEGCLAHSNLTHSALFELSPETEPFFIYRISHYYYGLLGSILVFMIAIPMIWFTKDNAKTANRDLISPVMQWAVPESKAPLYQSVERAMHIIEKNSVV